MSVELVDSNGPLESADRVYGRINDAPKSFSPDLLYDFIKSRTDTLYPTQGQLSSLDDYVTAFTLQKDDADNTKWDGQSLIARGFAEATGPTDLVVYQQLQDAVLSTTFDIPGLTVIDTVNSTDDLLLIYDASTDVYKSATPNQLISGLDPDLGAIAALTGTGFGARTADNTWALRSLTEPASGLTISNPAGIAGNPTFALANDLAALETLASTGFATRTASDAWAQRTLQQPAAGLTITNPAGVAGDPTFVLANDLAALEALSGTNTIYYRSALDTWTAVTIGGMLSFSGGSLDIGDAELAALASLSSASNRLPYFTGSGTADLLTLDTDGTLAANSDTTLASQKAVKTYVDQIIASQDAMVFKGVIDCSANPNYPAADRGWTYRVSVAGKIGGASGTNVEVGDILICLTDSTASGDQATVGTSWSVTQANLDGAVIGPSSVTDSHFAQFDGTTGKLIKGGLSLDTDGTLSANSATRVPSQSAVKTYAQPLDATLTALAGVSTAADKLIYATGSDAFTTTDLSTFARTLIDDADAATMRTTLGLVIGTNVQAYDAELAAIAGLTSAANKIPYFTGSATASTADFTASGRAMVAAASADAQTALLSGFTGDSGAGGVKGLVPAPATGDAAASKFLKADGTWTTPSGSGDVTAASTFGTDNRLVRSDGTSKGVQASDVTVDDAAGVSGVTSMNSGPLAGIRNRLINGAGRFFQRQLTGAAAATNGVYGFDRWYSLNQSAGVTLSQQTDVENTTPFMMRISQANASAQRFGLAQWIEAANCKDLRGTTVVLSARVRCSNSTTLRYAVLEWTGTADTPGYATTARDPVNDWTSGTYTVANFFKNTTTTVSGTGSIALTANTLTDITALSVTLGSSLNNIIVMFWTDSTQAQNSTLDIGKVQLEIGSTATPFEFRDYSQELAKCQRYYYKSYRQSVAPGASSDFLGCLSQRAPSTDRPVCFVDLPAVMRTTPSVTIYSPQTGTSAKLHNDNTGSNVDGGVWSRATSERFIATLTTNPVTTGHLFLAHVVGDAEI